MTPAQAMPARPDLISLRAEFDTRGMQGWLWQWLTGVLTDFVAIRLTRRYKPSLYSPSGQWDEEGIVGLVNDFLIHDGIERGTVLAGLQRAENAAGFVRYLETSLYNYAVSQRRRTVRGNILRRLANVLATDTDLTRFSEPGRQAAYGLASWVTSPPARLGDDDISKLSKYFPHDISRAEYLAGDRQSPVISSADLRRIARGLIAGSHRLLSASQIMSVIEARYDLSADEAEHQSSDVVEAQNVSTSALEPLQDIAAEEIARHALGRLSARQQTVLRAWLEADSASVRSIAEQLELGKSLVNDEQQAIKSVFQSLPIVGSDERMQVLNKAAALLAGRP